MAGMINSFSIVHSPRREANQLPYHRFRVASGNPTDFVTFNKRDDGFHWEMFDCDPASTKGARVPAASAQLPATETATAVKSSSVA